jgi:prepilin-type N-terminal cleavage/methylation domain-containing protein
MDAVRVVSRRGWTLHEMIISLTIMGIVVALAAHTATGQLRFFRGVGEIVAQRSQIGHAGAIAASVLWGASSVGGDITVAQDSAIEVLVTIGSAVTCDGTPGHVTIPAAAAAPGNALAAFIASPNAGDRVVAFFEDTLGATWLGLHAASAASSGGGCVHFPSVAATWTVELREPLTVPAGTVLRFMRPLRLSLYRASDNRWYLGAKDWNGAAQRFNSIQPLAGPLAPYSADPTKAGLHFGYRDSQGVELQDPVEVNRIASVTIVARGESARPVRVGGLKSGPSETYSDSTAVIVGLRNTR